MGTQFTRSNGDVEFQTKETLATEESLNEVRKKAEKLTYNVRKTIRQDKLIVGGAATANDVISENASTGTDWDFDFGEDFANGGYITKCILTIATHALTERTLLWLYSQPPVGVVNDNVASTHPLPADELNLEGWIEIPALFDTSAAGTSYAMCTPSTVGNLAVSFSTSKLFGVLLGLDGGTLGNALCTLRLTGDTEVS